MNRSIETKDYKNNGSILKSWLKLIPYISIKKKLLLSLIIANIFIAIADVIFPYLDKIAIDALATQNYVQKDILYFILIYSTLIIFNFLAFYLFHKYSSSVEANISYRLRKSLFEKFQRLKVGFYDVNSSGFLIARITGDATKLSEILTWSIFSLVWAMLNAVFIILIMLKTDYKLTIFLVLLSPIFIAITYVFNVVMFKSYRIARKLNSRITNNFSETISGLKTIKTLGIESAMYEDFKKNTKEMKDHLIKVIHINALFKPVFDFISSFAIALIIYYGGRSVLDGNISIGVLTMFISYAKMFFKPFVSFAYSFADVQLASANVERIVDILESDDVIKEKEEEVIIKYGDNLAFDKNDNKFKGDIIFKDVSFSYIKGEPILEEFNLSIKKGETIALVGPTGSGKSTIVNLICRFYEPDIGEILIDGINYRNYSMPYILSRIGYVIQTPFLFNQTVLNNIVCGNNSISKEDVIEVTKNLNAHDFIMDLKNGYETIVGENGNILSGG